MYMARNTITTSHQKRRTILPEILVGQLITGSWLRRDANTIQEEFVMFNWAELEGRESYSDEVCCLRA